MKRSIGFLEFGTSERNCCYIYRTIMFRSLRSPCGLGTGLAHIRLFISLDEKPSSLSRVPGGILYPGGWEIYTNTWPPPPHRGTVPIIRLRSLDTLLLVKVNTGRRPPSRAGHIDHRGRSRRISGRLEHPARCLLELPSCGFASRFRNLPQGKNASPVPTYAMYRLAIQRTQCYTQQYLPRFCEVLELSGVKVSADREKTTLRCKR